LDATEALPGAAALRAESYDLLGLPAATTVVDVGCGTGRVAGELAQRGVWAVGVDVSEHMITVARERWPGAEFGCASATALPLANASVHGYRADKVFHEIDDPAAALAEARRVLAPGGRTVLLGQDWDAFVIDSDLPGLTRTIVAARAHTITTPRIARRYRNLLLDNGFTEVTHALRCSPAISWCLCWLDSPKPPIPSAPSPATKPTAGSPSKPAAVARTASCSPCRSMSPQPPHPPTGTRQPSASPHSASTPILRTPALMTIAVAADRPVQADQSSVGRNPAAVTATSRDTAASPLRSAAPAKACRQ
jgi:Methyltransferase domain